MCGMGPIVCCQILSTASAESSTDPSSSSFRFPCRVNPNSQSPSCCLETLERMSSRDIRRLLYDLNDRACSHRVPAFANRKPQPLLQRHRRDQTHFHRYVVSRHHHLHSRRQLHISRHVRRPEIKLWPVSRKEWRMPSAFFLLQHVC